MNYHDLDPEEARTEITRLIKEDRQPGDGGFSNGTEAMGWANCNCDNCVRSFLFRNPDRHETYEMVEADEMAVQGKECPGKLAIDYGWLTGAIPGIVVRWIGGDGSGRLPNRCAHFSEDDRDNPDLQPEPTDPNQLRLPFLLVELFGIADPDVLVFDTAIIEKKDLIPQWAH
ncbi:MAG: hypothetical protein KDC70_00010 [Saprospiraceae bacterium]|nr:hypothetical protein [Saprospiraceae bacterium]